MKEELRKLAVSGTSIISLSGIGSALGVDNITQINMSGVNYTNATGPGITELSKKTGSVFGGKLAGSTQMGGLLFLFFMAFIGYKLDLSTDTSAAIMLPTTFFLAAEGLLPFGRGIVYGLVLVVAGLGIFGVIKFSDR